MWKTFSPLAHMSHLSPRRNCCLFATSTHIRRYPNVSTTSSLSTSKPVRFAHHNPQPIQRDPADQGYFLQDECVTLDNTEANQENCKYRQQNIIRSMCLVTKQRVTNLKSSKILSRLFSPKLINFAHLDQLTGTVCIFLHGTSRTLSKTPQKGTLRLTTFWLVINSM